MIWRVGQKVVCVNDIFNRRSNEFYPVAGHTYTIRGIFADRVLIGFTLEEFVNPLSLFRTSKGLVEEEPHFVSRRFRPLVEPEADISVFTEILDKLNAKVPEKVV